MSERYHCPCEPCVSPKRILLAHGGGGKLMHDLIEEIFLPSFKNSFLEQRHDGAVINLNNVKLAFTTDSYVVKPLFFPGGDIGSLAVNGTVNDLAMCGAKPLYLSCGLILEEGFSIELLEKIIKSMKAASDVSGVQLVCGDTKVVDKGKGDGIFINTCGIGIVEHSLSISPQSIKPGDAIILNGDLGRHGITIMASREGLSFESNIQSDCASLSGLVDKILKAGTKVHCMRDLTRGGLGSALVEIAEAAGVHIEIDESFIPISENVLGVCEILGLDPMYVANEGRFIIFVDQNEATKVLDLMKLDPLGKDAGIIGYVKKESKDGIVSMKSKLGTSRIIDMLSGEQLPRIC